ncbi:1-aminocyclopropane-1-carboxylate deaminase/D-cysteine desulfhydrase [Pseudonocardia sp. TRM90224]|uniref:1-aminocyclopropane-1-carboxylate deaminase/D-cysteine desulfhydrase n=1 Tax=Pseudonocardia sp. TRM90224 TaxID=2812678 RepID=UPI001E50699D|nr:pyridoxal-phosphate dependent enzyme [Pseudonocardia sp. TRM90224]
MSVSGVDLRLPSPLQEVRDERLRGVRLLVKRDDLIGTDLSGNKWRKLAHLITDAQRSGASTLLTFGGAYSNHIRAVAAAGREFGFRTIGVVRGEERPTNASLDRAIELGMQLHYVSRTEYRQKHDPAFLTDLRERFGSVYVVPEGGSTPFAIPGCAALVSEIDQPFDLICCPVGTGGTLAGLAAGLGSGQRARGFSVLRGVTSLGADVGALQAAAVGSVLQNWDIDHRFHFGGFAKRTPELVAFADDFAERHGIELEMVYVAKMLFGIFACIADDEIRRGTTVVAVITGAPYPDRHRRSSSAPTVRS